MKIENTRKFKLPTTLLQTLRLSYKKNANSKVIQISLRKLTQIIHKYDRENKKILFVDFPKQHHKILKFNKHEQISGFLLNKIWDPLTKTKRDVSNIISKFKLKKKADIIILHNSTKNFNVIKKSYLMSIPLIIVGETKKIGDPNKNLYSSGWNYELPVEKTESTDLFLNLIKSILEERDKDSSKETLEADNSDDSRLLPK